VLIGSVGAQQARAAQPSFLLGTSAAATAWFFALAFGARLLGPYFSRPYAWRLLDALVGLTMFTLAASLGMDALLAM